MLSGGLILSGKGSLLYVFCQQSYGCSILQSRLPEGYYYVLPCFSPVRTSSALPVCAEGPISHLPTVLASPPFHPKLALIFG